MGFINEFDPFSPQNIEKSNWRWNSKDVLL